MNQGRLLGGRAEVLAGFDRTRGAVFGGMGGMWRRFRV